MNSATDLAGDELGTSNKRGNVHTSVTGARSPSALVWGRLDHGIIRICLRDLSHCCHANVNPACEDERSRFGLTSPGLPLANAVSGSAPSPLEQSSTPMWPRFWKPFVVVIPSAAIVL